MVAMPEVATLIAYTISLLVAMVGIAAALYFFVRAVPGLEDRGAVGWFVAPLAILTEGAYRPEYRIYARRLRLSFVVTAAALLILTLTG